MNRKYRLLALILGALLTLTACSIEIVEEEPVSAEPVAAVVSEAEVSEPAEAPQTAADSGVITLDNIPEYAGEPYVEINGNVPEFSEDQFTTESYEFYTELDQIGRCGACYANIGQDLMPTEDRGSISSVHPSGWVQAQYDFVEGKSLYNRCHLIGFQLTGENANDHNLITGTRYLNVTGMLPFENLVADYIRETGNHVLYRVTPIYEGSNLVASGVQMEAISVEDRGEGVCFNIYCYNVQPGVIINYATGESQADPDAFTEGEQMEYILNTSGRKFHLPDCSSVNAMKEENRQEYSGTRENLIAQGYAPCGNCDP